MLVWQGWGVLAALIPIGMIVVTTIVWGVIAGRSSPSDAETTLILGVSLLASAPLILLLGKRLDARPGRTMIDKESGQEVVLREAHTLFFVRMRYWAFLAAGLGVLLVVVGILPTS